MPGLFSRLRRSVSGLFRAGGRGPAPFTWQDGDEVMIDARAALAAQQVERWQYGTPQYPPPGGASILKHGVHGNELIAAGLRIITGIFCQGQLRVRDRQSLKPIVDHDLEKLFRAPEPGVDQYRFWEGVLQDWFTYGNDFLEILIGRRTGLPLQLWRLDPPKISIVPGNLGEVGHYEYQVDGLWYKVPAWSVIHARTAHRRDEWFGKSPLHAALHAIAMDNSATDFLSNVMKNYAVPPIVIETKESGFTAAQIKEAKKQWQKTAGGKSIGKVQIVQAATVNKLGMSLEELSFPALNERLETRVLMALGGAPLLYAVGAQAGLSRATYSNYAQAREALVEEVVAPLWDRFRDAVAAPLLGFWDNSAELEPFFDTSNVGGMQTIANERKELAKSGLMAGVMTLNEARAHWGLPPRAADVVYFPAGVDPWKVDANGKLLGRVQPESRLSLPPDDEEVLLDSQGDA